MILPDGLAISDRSERIGNPSLIRRGIQAAGSFPVCA